MAGMSSKEICFARNEAKASGVDIDRAKGIAIPNVVFGCDEKGDRVVITIDTPFGLTQHILGFNHSKLVYEAFGKMIENARGRQSGLIMPEGGRIQ